MNEQVPSKEIVEAWLIKNVGTRCLEEYSGMCSLCSIWKMFDETTWPTPEPPAVLLSHAKWLRQCADEIAKEGHAGWGNTCLQAAEAIERSAQPPAADSPWKTFAEAVPEQGRPVWWSQNGDKPTMHNGYDFCDRDDGEWCYLLPPPRAAQPPAAVVSKFDLAFEIMRLMECEELDTMQSCHFGYVLRVEREKHTPTKGEG